MLKTELFEMLRNGESSGVEFKLDTIEPRALAKELVALANLQGGVVLLGVEDGGTVRGITRPRLEEWVMSACRDKIRPELIPYFEVIREIETGRDAAVAVVRVDQGWSVHHVWHDHHRTYYIRVGSTSREASQEELERLFQQRGGFRVELRPVSGSGLDDLDRNRLKDYFGRVRQQEVPKTEEDWRTLLVNTELLSDEGHGTPCTVAGLLLFGENPNRFLPQAGIDAVAYPGLEKDYASLERASLRGPLTPLLRKGRRTPIENGLVEQAVGFIRRHSGATTTLAEGARRTERLDYPVEAVREALVNALVHRDYLLSSTDIELSLYKDRLEIVSPGRLPNGITPERMRVGCRAARNQLLKDVMRDYGYLEHMGMGIPRKIIRTMLKHNGTEPGLIEEGEQFAVRLWREGQRPV
ncbi:MAG: ATP-binding protein [Thermoanaerobaculia bacterium]